VWKGNISRDGPGVKREARECDGRAAAGRASRWGRGDAAQGWVNKGTTGSSTVGQGALGRSFYCPLKQLKHEKKPRLPTCRLPAADWLLLLAAGTPRLGGGLSKGGPEPSSHRQMRSAGVEGAGGGIAHAMLSATGTQHSTPCNRLRCGCSSCQTVRTHASTAGSHLPATHLPSLAASCIGLTC
jgi:hypothetical protein